MIEISDEPVADPGTEAKRQRRPGRRPDLYFSDMDALLIIDAASYDILATDEGAGLLLGYSHDEIVGRNASEFLGAESRERFRRELSHEEERFGHYDAVRKDGTTLPVSVKAKAIQYPGRRVLAVAVCDVSKRRHEEALRALQSSALEATASAVMITDGQGRILWANAACCRLTGYSLQEMQDQQPSLLKSDTQDPASYGRLWHKIGAGEMWQGELINRRKDGSEYIEEQTITPLLNERGEVTHFIAVKQDVSERIASEVESKRLKELNEGIVMNVQEGITIQDGNGYFKWVNPAIAQKLGYQADELVGKHWSVIIPESLHSVVVAADRRRMQGKMDRYELQLVGKDGKARPVLVSGTPWYEDGRIAGTMAVFTDLSERIQQERERDIIFAAAAALRKARDRSEMPSIILTQILELFGAKAALISMRDPDNGETVIELGKGAWSPATGLRLPPGAGVSGEIIAAGKPILYNEMRELPEELGGPASGSMLCLAGVPLIAQEQVIGALLAGCQEPFSEIEVRLLTALGDMAASAIQRATLHYQTQQHALDLEHRIAQRTRALADANERLQELDRLKSKFISDVSHELRTPITNLNLYLDLLIRGKPEQQARYITVLKREVGRLGRLVEDILSLSRLEMSRGRELRFGAIDLNEIVAEIVATLRPRVEAQELALSFEPSTGSLLIFGEQNQIAQVVTNLISNAITYTPAGGIYVQTWLEHDQGMGRLTVGDTGMGIEAEELAHVFERFYRGQKTGQSDIPGTGLGLAIVREIVDMHGGRIEAESALEKGSVFNVWLPLASGDPPAPVSRNEAGNGVESLER